MFKCLINITFKITQFVKINGMKKARKLQNLIKIL